MPLFSVLASLVLAEPTCFEGPRAASGAPTSIDPPVLGFEELTLQCSAGSGGAGCEVTLSGPSGELSWSNGSSYSDMVDVDPIPEELLAASPADRRRIALLLYGRVCDGPDPTLQRLSDPDGPLEWIEGQPAFGDMYVVEDGAVWRSVKVHTQRGLVAWPGETYPMLLAEDSRLRAWRYAHGVVLETVDGAWHAWAWVNPGGLVPYPMSKLRVAIPIEGGITHDELVLIVGSEDPFGEAGFGSEVRAQRAEVRVRLVLPTD